jgi:hypothetical protein
VGWLALTTNQVVGLRAGDQKLGSVGVGVERVGGDDCPGQVQPVQQGLEGGDLAGGAADLALGQHCAGGVVHRGQQVDLPAVAFGAAQRLAVDRDCLAALLGAVAVAKPGADRRGQGLRVQAAQGLADGGLGRDAVVVGVSRRAPSAARTLWGVSAAHSAIAVIERAPASTAAAAMARMAISGWRWPRGARGSGMVAR